MYLPNKFLHMLHLRHFRKVWQLSLTCPIRGCKMIVVYTITTFNNEDKLNEFVKEQRVKQLIDFANYRYLGIRCNTICNIKNFKLDASQFKKTIRNFLLRIFFSSVSKYGNDFRTNEDIEPSRYLDFKRFNISR